jgi:hypothetical protein
LKRPEKAWKQWEETNVYEVMVTMMGNSTPGLPHGIQENSPALSPIEYGNKYKQRGCTLEFLCTFGVKYLNCFEASNFLSHRLGLPHCPKGQGG